MAEKLLKKLGEVLPRVVNGAWGQYCLCSSLLAVKFGCLGAEVREETLRVLGEGNGVEVLDKVVAAAVAFSKWWGPRGVR